MSRVDVQIVTDKEPDVGARPVPAWIDDEDTVAPCPNCDDPPDPSVVVLVGKYSGLKRWIHLRCFPWLENELPREEVEEMFYWTKRQLERGPDGQE